MKFYQINNISTLSGEVDYKGLDINSFVPRTQKYDFDNDFCITATHEKGIEIASPDLIELTEGEYVSHRQAIELVEQTNAINFVSDQAKIAMLEQTQTDQDEILMLILLGGA